VYRGVNSQGVHPSGDLTGNDAIGGQAVIYISGHFTLGNSTQICGWNTSTDSAAKTGSNCDFSKWTPNTSMLMIIAHGSGNSISFGQSCYFQGALYALNGASIGQSCQTEGPMIASTLSVGQSVNMKPLPGITDLPVGAPGNPNTSGVPEAPAYGGG
jgi:hypothetical protein